MSTTKQYLTSASAYMANFENILTPGKEPVMTKKYKPLVACQFDRYLNPRTLKRHVLRSEKVRQIIAHYAQQLNCPPQQIEQQASAIIDEIGLDRNMAIIRWCGIVITAIGKRISSGIYVNKASVESVKEKLGRNPVLYLPSHRSYMDFILMSYICFHYEIEIPGIAAGMDFHSMFGMGTMLRKTGAFFMRRTFTGEELYWDIFREYMYALIAVYHIGVEFFIEGTRSRNFKALLPKIGLLSMALLPYFTGDVSDITIIPVSVSYERLLEEQLFVYELLGVPKPKESTKGFFKALKIVEERFGRMYLDFGEPISVRDFFGHKSRDRIERASVGAHLQTLNKREIELVKRLATEIIYQQQRYIVISTFNLLSLYFASRLYAQCSVTIDELANGIRHLKGIFEELGAHVATDVNRIKPEIIETVEIHENIVHFKNGRLQLTQAAVGQLAQDIDTRSLKAHNLTPQTIAVPSMALQLYINPCLFWVARPAYLIMAALQIQMQQSSHSGDAPSNYGELLTSLSRRVAVLDEIFKYEFIIESSREVEEFERNLKFLQTNGVINITSKTGHIAVNENECSRVILSAIAPFLCVYYQLTVTLNRKFVRTNDEFTSKDVLVAMQDRIEQLLHDNVQTYVHPYCLALDNLNIALNAFVQEMYLTKDKISGNLRRSSVKSLSQLEDELLNHCRLLPFKQYYIYTDQRTLSKL